MKFKSNSKSHFKKMSRALQWETGSIIHKYADKSLGKTLLKNAKFFNSKNHFSVFINGCANSISRTKTEGELHSFLVSLNIILCAFPFNIEINKKECEVLRASREKIIDLAFEVNPFKTQKNSFIYDLENRKVPSSIKMLGLTEEKNENYADACAIMESYGKMLATYLNLPMYKRKELVLLIRYFTIYKIIKLENRYRNKLGNTTSIFKQKPKRYIILTMELFFKKMNQKAMAVANDNFNLIVQTALYCS